MNLKEMDLGHLVMLWQAADGNPLIKQQIESEFKIRIANNSNFNREYFLDICKIKNHAMTVSFIPTSDGYKRYGPNLTIDIILSEEELQELIRNYSSKPAIQTSGIIRAKILVKDGLSEHQIAEAAEIGFHTSDIFETMHL